MAHVIEVTEKGMQAIDRCDRCGAQAYVEVALESGGVLLFCSHHATENWGKLLTMNAIIADHRPALAKQETKQEAPA